MRKARFVQTQWPDQSKSLIFQLIFGQNNPLERLELVFLLIFIIKHMSRHFFHPFEAIPAYLLVLGPFPGRFWAFLSIFLQLGQNNELFRPLPVAGSEILFFHVLLDRCTKHLQKTACQKLFLFSHIKWSYTHPLTKKLVLLIYRDNNNNNNNNNIIIIFTL